MIFKQKRAKKLKKVEILIKKYLTKCVRKDSEKYLNLCRREARSFRYSGGP